LNQSSVYAPMPAALNAGIEVESQTLASPNWRFAQFLLLYSAVLMTFAAFALGSGPLHHDMTEAWAWGKEFQLGYAKHPPISAWLAGAWFTALPRNQSSFYLLSTLNLALALAGVWSLAGLFLDRRARWVATLFLVLTPSFSVWALKFNANAPLLSTWPWLTYFFLRSLETRRLDFAIWAGVLGALALLTKYYSLALFCTLFLVAVLHPDRRRYFCSSAPYVTSAVGLLLIAPHVYWTIASGFPAIDYAVSKTHYAVAEARRSSITALFVSLALFGVPMGAFLIALGQRSWTPLKRSILATFEQRNAWLVSLAYGPLALTMLSYLVFNARITNGFLIPAFFALPIVFLLLSGAEITSIALRRFALCVAAIWLPLAIASPLLGYHSLRHGRGMRVEPREEVAAAATEFWHSSFGRPLKIVAGKERLATAVTFYSSDAPSYLMLETPEHTPWVTSQQMHRDGVLIICPAEHRRCLGRAAAFAGNDPVRTTRQFATRFLGNLAKPQSFVFIAYPPVNIR
jgi:Dolichyl-phosphate-mannose-protein mannosyltransferase